MTNSYQGYGPDEMPTAPHTVTQAGFGGPGGGGPGSGGPGSGGPGSGGPGSGGHRRWWAAVLAITVVLAGGGAFAAAEAATGSPAAPAALTASQASATTQAATATPAKQDGRRPGRLARLRRVGGEYGQVTFATKTGVRTLAFERGTIESVSGNDVMVRTQKGMTEAWTLTSKSVVRDSGKRSTDSALKPGELVFTAGPVTGGAHDIGVIVIRKAAPSAAQPTT